MRYFVKTPWLIKKVFPNYTWDIKTDKKSLFFTFDDGPHPQITEFVLDQLKIYNAKATFFCIGKNVVKNPELYHRISRDGHAVGNHTYNHLNGWKTKSEFYMNDISEAAIHIKSNLFRPPYGKITSFQANCLNYAMGVANPKVIMWDVLSADFDTAITPKQSMNNVIKHARSGSIVVFHDSEKAFPRLEKILPALLEFYTQKGFLFDYLYQDYITGNND